MNVTEDLINILKEMTADEFIFFEALTDSIEENDETFEQVGGALEAKLVEFDTEEFNILKASLYYLGFKHGMEEGLRIANEQQGETN